MKKERKEDTDTMRDEYHFDYSKGEWGKFAGKVKRSGKKVVTIEAEVAKVFPDSASVNAALSGLIEYSKKATAPKPRPKSRRASVTAKVVKA